MHYYVFCWYNLNYCLGCVTQIKFQIEKKHPTMKEVNVSIMIGGIMKRFQLVGCDVTSKHTLRASLLFYFVVASELSIVFACIFRLLLLENPTVEDFKDAFIFLPILLQMLLKYASVYYNKDKMRLILQQIEGKYWEISLEKDAKYVSKYQKHMKLLDMMNNSVRYLIFVAILVHGITSVFERKQIIKTWLPFDESHLSNDLVFAAVIFWQTVGYFYPIYFTITEIDCFFLTTTGTIALQMNFIGHVLNSLENFDGDDKNRVRILKKCVAHYSTLTDLVRYIEELFRIPILVQILNTIYGIGFSVYSITTEIDPIQPTFTMTILFELLLYCLFGENIQTQSSAIGNAVYNCGWEKTNDTTVAICVHMTITKSHRFPKITGGKFFVLSFKLFQKVVRTSISVLTLLLSVTNNEPVSQEKIETHKNLF